MGNSLNPVFSCSFLPVRVSDTRLILLPIERRGPENETIDGFSLCEVVEGT